MQGRPLQFPEPRLSVRSLWPSLSSGPSSEQGPPSSAYTPVLLVNTNAPLPSQSPSAARTCRSPRHAVTVET